MASLVWVNTLRGSQKVWGADLYGNYTTGKANIIFYWGRIGRPIQSLRKLNKCFSNTETARDFFYEKLRQKRATGYIPIENHLYFGHIDDDRPLSELFKLIEKKYKELGY